MRSMIAALLSLVVVSSSLEVQDAVYPCTDGQGNTYYSAGGCKLGDKPAVQINATGTPMVTHVPQAPQVPMAPQVQTPPPASRPAVPLK
ncbi:MAG TPA: hypothetical protein VHE37_00885 [Nevskiaceae bacterium]|nr:hypothetical protein [Nevskiaceae bacterium]